MSHTPSCSCTGTCGSRWCVGYMTWGRRCGLRTNDVHPHTAERVRVIAGRCRFCRRAEQAKKRRETRTRQLLATSDGQTESLFGGGTA